MKIINVIEVEKGSVAHITSFCVINEESIESVSEKAVNKFKSILNSKFNISEKDIKTHIENGYFENDEYVLTIQMSDEIY